MDLIEFHKSYMKGVSRSLSILWRSLALLRDDQGNRRELELAFRAAHAIKGSSWTMREAPCALNNDAPDDLYNAAATAAEELETYLEAVLKGETIAERDWLILRLAEIEMAVAQVSVRLNVSPESEFDVN